MSVSPAPLFSFSDFETACVYFLDSGESALCIQEDIPQNMTLRNSFHYWDLTAFTFGVYVKSMPLYNPLQGLSMAHVGLIQLDNKPESFDYYKMVFL